MENMRKQLFIALCLFGTVLTANAQLKVANNGIVYMRGDSVFSHTLVNIGQHKDSMTHFSDSICTGLRCFFYDTENAHRTVGVFGEAMKANPIAQRSTMGVWGVGGGAYAGRNIGVAGTLHSGKAGAGIYGANQENAFFTLGEPLAGYFYGPLYVVGRVTSTVGYTTVSDMRLKRNVVRVADNERETGSTLDRLTGLDVLEYNIRTPRQDEIAAMPDSLKPTGKDPNPDIRHYGVSAQELQKLYPDLVFEDGDGYLSVNYVEMVPLLLRSMQELKAELDKLKGKETTDENYMARQATTAMGTNVMSLRDRVSPLNAVLYQNTPNPFTAQTEIRFSLPDDAPQAYIYIFDMTGKMQKQIPVDSNQQSVTINGYELSAGIYLYSLVVGGQEIDTKRMILSK